MTRPLMTMTSLNVYLNFNNNCREAMEFYKSVFGGELSLQTVGESPAKADMPAETYDKVMHAYLQGGAVALMASDALGPGGYIPGNTISLSINSTDETELKSLFAKLSECSTVTMPLAPTFWGPLFGMLTDKFGINWMFNLDTQSKV